MQKTKGGKTTRLDVLQYEAASCHVTNQANMERRKKEEGGWGEENKRYSRR